MKKRLFAGFAALCMAASLASAAFAETATPETARAETPQAIQYDASEDAAGFAVSAAADPGVLPDGAQLAVNLLDDSAEGTPDPLPDYGERAAALDLTFYKEDATVEPSGTVKVNIQLPEALAADLQAVESPTVVHRVQQDDGTTTPEVVAEADAFSEDRTQVSFETDSFSVYEIYGVVPEEEQQEENNAIDTYAGAVVNSVVIVDSVKTDGRLTLKAFDASGTEISAQKLKDAGYTISWKKDGKEVTRVIAATIDDVDQYNMAVDGAWVNVAFDEGARKTYTVTVVKDGTETTASKMVEQFDAIQNGSFEQPECTNKYQPYVDNKTSNVYWQTTATDGQIEIVSASDTKRDNGNTHKSLSQKWHGMSTAAEGTQYAELNANYESSLYQDVLTKPGSTMTWRVAHAKRSRSDSTTYRGSDEMYVVVMAADQAEKLAKDQTQLVKVAQELAKGNTTIDGVTYTGATSKLCSDNQADTWNYYSDTYTVPAGQYMTRYFFVSAKSASGDQTIGNHIDNVWFSTEVPPPLPGTGRVTITKNVYGLNLDTVRNQLSNKGFVYYKNGGDPTYIQYASADWKEATDGNGNPCISATYYLDVDIPAGGGSVNYTVGETAANAQVAGYTLQADETEKTVTLAKEDNEKNVTITNTYTPNTTTVTVSKTVTGTLGDKTKEFNFTLNVTDTNNNAVTGMQYRKGSNEELTEITADTSGFGFTLKDGESITFYKIPVGATVTVTEENYSDQKYTTTYQVDDKDRETGCIATTTATTNGNTIAFTNSKEISPDMGITLHSMPYLMVLAGVLVGGMAWMRRRKRS